MLIEQVWILDLLSIFLIWRVLNHLYMWMHSVIQCISIQEKFSQFIFHQMPKLPRKAITGFGQQLNLLFITFSTRSRNRSLYFIGYSGRGHAAWERGSGELGVTLVSGTPADISRRFIDLIQYWAHTLCFPAPGIGWLVMVREGGCLIQGLRLWGFFHALSKGIGSLDCKHNGLDLCVSFERLTEVSWDSTD